MTLIVTQQEAAAAAKRILGFYPEIPASDPHSFAAGLVQTLLIYPQPVVAQAVDPVIGIPAKIKFLNLAAIHELLDEWRDEYFLSLKRREPPPKALPEPPHDPEVAKRIEQGLRELSERLKSGFGP
jgi:hypothetical protein